MLYRVIVLLVFSVNTEAVKVILRDTNNACNNDNDNNNNNNGTRIIGGRQITIKNAPWQIAMFYDGEFACGGSVLTNRHILTAAHCVKGFQPRKIAIRAGSSYLRKGGQVRRISRIAYDKSYSERTSSNDIAIMKLAKPLKLSQSVRTVKLASDYQSQSGSASVTGFGLTKESAQDTSAVLREVIVQIIPLSECKEDYKKKDIKLYKNMLCAGATNGGKDACQGDSGGPLVEDGIQYGIVSFGVGCGRPDFPGVYTSVAMKRKWIRTALAAL